MKRKKVLLFAGLVALVAGYAVYDFEQERRSEELKEEESRLVYLKSEQINYLEFDSKNGKMVLEKTVDGWNLVSPLKDSATNAKVEDFIQALTTEKSKEVVEASSEKPLDLAAFGLDQPVGTIVIKDNLGDSRRISVGSVKNFQGDAYVRIDDRNEVSISSSTWFAKADKKVGDFRDLRLLRAPAAKIQSFKITKGAETFTVASKDGNWIYVENPQIKLDQNRVRGFITALNNTEAIEVILDKDITKADLQGWNFVTPAWKVFVDLGEGKFWQGSVAQGNDKIHRAYVSDPAFVFKISPTEQSRFTEFDLDSFRDRSEPFAFDDKKAKAIEIKTDLKTFQLTKSKEKPDSLEQWRLAQEVPGFSLNQDKVIDFVNKLPTLQVRDFTGLKTHPSLDKAARTATLKTETNEIIFSITIGNASKFKEKDGLMTTVYYTKTDKYPYVFTLSEEDYLSLKLEEILKSEKKEERP